MYCSEFIRRAPYSCLSPGYSQVYFLSQRVFSVVPPCSAVIIEFYCAAGELLYASHLRDEDLCPA